VTVIRREQVCPLRISVGVQVRYAPVRLTADVPHRVVDALTLYLNFFL